MHAAQHRLHTDAGALPRPRGFSPESGFYAVVFIRQIRPAPVTLAVGRHLLTHCTQGVFTRDEVKERNVSYIIYSRYISFVRGW